MIRSIQAYRGFAALLVVAYHANLIGGENFGQTAVTRFFNFGHAGVPFFFVLSGFIIYYIHNADIGDPLRIKQYLQKRITRIYPIYWIITFSVLPVYLLEPNFGSPYHRELASLIKSLLLIPQDHAPHLTVAWTLCHEMFFYVLFATLIYKRTLGQVFFAAWMLMTAGATLFTNVTSVALTFPGSFFLSTYNLLFGFGLLAGWLNNESRPERKLFGFISFILGNILFLTVGLMENYWTGKTDWSVLLFGMAAFVIILSAKDNRVERIFADNKLLQLLGNASYSIYLSHYLTVSMTGKIIARIELLAALPSVVNWALVIVIAVAIGVAVYLCVEKPTLSLARRYVSAKKRGQHPTA